ncbi:MAG: type III-A CRISPR-associated RAMP protein Csm5 [Bacteroidales bacterium]|nr:type III-A CRISPR-associated RAMP protein Csm5 [Bacteroidales bacterium]
MSRIKIETLTSVHIGSGENLQYGSDFVKGQNANGKIFGLIDAQKIMSLIGEEHISNWVAAIERKESSEEIVKQFAPNSDIEDYSKRVILDWSDGARTSDTLKEFIHDGMGKPYIPGSSIKGAIRTAIVASLAAQRHNLESKIQDRKGKPTAKNVEAMLFGADPNSDVFRFLQVGDAVFGNNYEVALRMVNINEREKKGFWDTSKSQLIEALGPEDESEFQMKLASDYYGFAKKKWPQNARNSIGILPEEMQTLQSLFKIINEHTSQLVESEIRYWEDRESADESESVHDYIERMKEIRNHIKNCKGGSECVLRIGHGSGWRFITGAWAEGLENFSSLVVPVSRPKNFNYEQYDFPKTRRVDDQCELLGFVKLTSL